MACQPNSGGFTPWSRCGKLDDMSRLQIIKTRYADISRMGQRSVWTNCVLVVITATFGLGTSPRAVFAHIIVHDRILSSYDGCVQENRVVLTFKLAESMITYLLYRCLLYIKTSKIGYTHLLATIPRAVSTMSLPASATRNLHYPQCKHSLSKKHFTNAGGSLAVVEILPCAVGD